MNTIRSDYTVFTDHQN